MEDNEHLNPRRNLQQMETNMFLPYTALGLVCSSVPPMLVPPPPDVERNYNLIYCALDNQINAYIDKPFRLLFTTDPIESEITLMTADSVRIYAAFSNFVVIVKNGKVEHRLVIPNGGAKLLLSLTDVLIVVDKQNTINVFDVEDAQPLVQLDNPASFEITAIMHPNTYLNKILVGSADGRMRLWNLRSGKLVHEFPAIEDSCVPIHVLEQSTAIDVVGMGMADGQIHLRNIKFDKLLCTFRQSGQIKALAFRTDGVDILASANSEGAIAVWDLNERRLIGRLLEAHKGPITWLHFLIGQPMMLSAGEDNKIVKWFFRNENSLPEVNTVLQGHSAPATALTFCAEQLIISSSIDGHVRQFNTEKYHAVKDYGMAREVRRADLSQDRYIDVALEPIMEMKISHGREACWDNMICRHENSPLVSTWSTRFMRRGTHLLFHERFAKRPELLTAYASSLFISNCGNFALIGYSSGHIDVFNMQSGKYKFSLEGNKISKEAGGQRIRRNRKSDDRGHEALVSGVVLDLLNRNVVTGASDGTIHFWQFNQPPKLRSKMRIAAGIRLFQLDLYNSLLAVGLENGEIGIIDVLCRRLARRLPHYSCMDWSENTHLTALEFSNDGKWLLSADNQGFIKVWDLSSAMLIDVLYCLSPCIGMAFSERGDYLATLHDGKRGIYLWANKLLFLTNTSMISKPAEELHRNAAQTSIPFVACRNKAINDDDKDDTQVESSESMNSQERTVMIDEDENEEDGDEESMNETRSQAGTSISLQSSFVEKEQLSPDLHTLSGLAPSRWSGLPMLDLIRQRNKPKEPPKKAKSAPFFLPTVDTLEGFQFDKSTLEKLNLEEEVEEKQRAIAVASRRLDSTETLQGKWLSALMRAKSPDDFNELFVQLREMSLSAIDFQIRLLNGTTQLTQFLAMLISIMETRMDFDLVQSYLATFLNIHHEQLWSDADNEKGEDGRKDEEMKMDEEIGKQGQQALTNNLKRILVIQKQVRDELQQLFDQNTSLAEFIKSALI